MKCGAANQGECAFTLVELMVVIVVVSIVSSVMIVEMSGTYEDTVLRANARKIIDVCDTASNRAIALGEKQVLRIDPKAGRLVVQSQRGEDSNPILGELDTRILLVVREPGVEEESEDLEVQPVTDPNTIIFEPDGSAEAREFLFRDRAGIELVLRILPATSRVRIIEMGTP